MKRRTSVVLFIIILLIIAAGTPPNRVSIEPAFAQRTQTAHLICCNLLISVPGKWIGADRKCTEYLDSATPEVRADACRQLRQGNAFRGNATCVLSMSPYCPMNELEPDSKCEPPSSSKSAYDPFGCKKMGPVKFTISPASRGKVSYSVSACGQTFYREANADRMFTTALANSFPKQMCCDNFGGGSSRGGACNPLLDADCDGTTNAKDSDPLDMPRSEDFYRKPKESTADPFPSDLDLSEITPQDVACEGCKWELVKGEKKCKPGSGGLSEFWYEATWRCPKTNAEVFRVSRIRALRRACG